MKLKPLAPNVTLITFKSGVQILFSYSTAVAGFKPDMGYFKTKTNYSSTTTRHINNYVSRMKVTEVDQAWIDNLVDM